ncbi:MAG: hypothetical protein H0V82_07090 [Candidatus Protochlamydia sp.]|nr:hypothetical protein [Candidatus Protochlamydia sp.]
MITEFDKEQLILIKKSIHDFESTEQNLDSLLKVGRSLEQLFDSLKNIDKEWKDNFRIEWGELEITAAIMMDKEISDLSKGSKDVIAEAITNMKVMIESILKL